VSSALPSPAGAFYFDLASPLAYLAAERALHALPGVEWRPLLAAELPGSETFEAFRCGSEADAFREDVERRAAQLGLQPVRWPPEFPFDSALAMRAATYAASIGRGVPFAQAAFRQAFAGGRSLGEPDNVLIAAAACEMHPRAVVAAMEREAVGEQLSETTAQAARAGVSDVPAVVLAAAPHVFEGERALEDAAAALGAGASA
jgi:2-hydroxychromene-2-carboxylate isomerase